MAKLNKGHWTIDKQDKMCHDLTYKIFHAVYHEKTTYSYQIIKQADRFPFGLKQYYADKLLLNTILVDMIIKERK